MKRPNHRQLLITLWLYAGLAASCKKFVDAGSPRNDLTTNKIFTDSTGAAAAVNGIYITLSSTSSGITIPAALSADELTTSRQGAEAEFYANNIKPANAQNATLWTNCYQQLYQANACVEGITSSPGLTQSQKDRLSSEARFVRAYLLFQLLNTYGPVPLVTMTDYRVSRSLPRATAGDLQAQILSDLRFAQSKLSPDQADTRRANYYAATALLARFYLYTKQYEAAGIEADKVINSGKFRLMDDLNAVFLATSKESLWRIVPVVTGRETWEAAIFVPSTATAVPPFVLSEGLLADLQPGDKRRSGWVGSNTVSGKTYAYPFKYKKVFSSGAPTEHYTLLRLAEQYLIRAEAKANTGDVTGAIEDLKTIQRRANADLYNGTAAGLPAAIELERRKELFCETGHRWFDLKRTGRARIVLGSVKTGWKETAQLFPIPQSQVDANPTLTQNPGY